MGSENIQRGKYALITGASSGFGYEFAKLFAADGYNIVIVARNEEKLRELAADFAQSFMVEALPIAKDLFKPTAALMRGESRIVSGMKNKMFAGMSNVMPDNALAKTMHKKMKPSTEPGGREVITHGPSREEREQIDRTTGGWGGDYESHEDHIHSKE